MDNIIHRLIDISQSGNYDIITIAETNHWSADSHKFHFCFLIKLLNSKIINTISSEILTNLDVLLINLWLRGKIRCTIEDLYKKILPRGGLGTYRWMQYIKQNNIKVKIIPSERDEFYPSIFTDKTELINALMAITTFKLTPDHFLDHDKFITLNPKTKMDKIVYKYIEDSFRDDRLQYWFDNISSNYTKNTKLFINGFHLDKYPISEGVLPLDKLGKTLHLGMGTAKMFVPFESEIVNLSDYYGLSELEALYKGKYAIIDSTTKGMFKTRGAEIDITGTLSDISFRTDRYDFIIFIPQSRFGRRMYF